MSEEIYKQACEYAQAGDYVEAAKCFKKAANEGHIKAQYNLAVCLHEGLGGYQAHMEAFYYFKKAADGGHDRAHYMLGCYFAMGLAPYESKEEGIEHFRIAAEAGVADAQYNYGVYLLEEKRADEATVYFQKAMEQGSADGAYNLGICYAKGLGVEAHDDKAIECLELAVSKGHEKAGSALTRVLKDSYAPSGKS